MGVGGCGGGDDWHFCGSFCLRYKTDCRKNIFEITLEKSMKSNISIEEGPIFVRPPISRTDLLIKHGQSILLSVLLLVINQPHGPSAHRHRKNHPVVQSLVYGRQSEGAPNI